MNKGRKDKIKNSTFFVTLLLITILLLCPISQSVCISNEENSDFSIVIHRIKQEDEIDPSIHGEADWQLRMYVNGIIKVYEIEGDDLTPNRLFTWANVIQEDDTTVEVKFELLEKDTGIWPDLHDIADISAYQDTDYEDGDYDDTDDFSSNRPAVFKRTYDLIENTWMPVDDDNDFLDEVDEEGIFWYKTSGLFDGSTNYDENDASIWFNVFTENLPPYIPTKPNGIKIGLVDTYYEYSTSSADPDGDVYQFGWDWDGDDVIDELTEYYSDPFQSITISHSWDEPGIYYVKVTAIDSEGMASEWSDTLVVEINGPGGINGFKVDEWGLGHVYSLYLNHDKTQELITIIKTATNVITSVATFVSAIASALGRPINLATAIAIATAIARLGIEVLSTMDKGYGIYCRVYVIEFMDAPFPSFAYIWSQTLAGNERIDSTPPEIPQKPSGVSTGQPGLEYSFSTSCEDVDSQELVYIYDWGNGEYSWTDWYNVDETATEKYTYSEEGNYEIRVKALDDQGFESDWSEPTSIDIVKSRNVLGLFSFEKILYHFPFFSRLIQKLSR